MAAVVATLAARQAATGRRDGPHQARGPVGWCAGRARGAPRRWCRASGGPWSSTSPGRRGSPRRAGRRRHRGLGHQTGHGDGPGRRRAGRRPGSSRHRTAQPIRERPATRSAAQALAVAPRSSSQPSGTRMLSRRRTPSPGPRVRGWEPSSVRLRATATTPRSASYPRATSARPRQGFTRPSVSSAARRATDAAWRQQRVDPHPPARRAVGADQVGVGRNLLQPARPRPARTRWFSPPGAAGGTPRRRGARTCSTSPTPSRSPGGRRRRPSRSARRSRRGGRRLRRWRGRRRRRRPRVGRRAPGWGAAGGRPGERRGRPTQLEG